MKSKSFDPLIIVLFSLILSLPMRGQDYIPKFVTDETILDLANEVKLMVGSTFEGESERTIY